VLERKVGLWHFIEPGLRHFQIFATTLWIIWCFRNACHWENKPANLTTMMKLAADVV